MYASDPFAQENSSPGKEDKAHEALRLLTGGVQADPRNAQLRFQRAHVLLNLAARLEMDGGDMVRNKASANVAALEGRTHVEMLEEACEELVRVKELSPREPYVYVVLGEVNEFSYYRNRHIYQLF